MKAVEDRFANRGNVVIYSFVRHSLYAFYKLVDDGLRENSLSDHG